MDIWFDLLRVGYAKYNDFRSICDSFGLGIDYGIHYYARYIELRSEGLGIQQPF